MKLNSNHTAYVDIPLPASISVEVLRVLSERVLRISAESNAATPEQVQDHLNKFLNDMEKSYED